MLREAGWQPKHNIASRVNHDGFHSALKSPVCCKQNEIYCHVTRELSSLKESEGKDSNSYIHGTYCVKQPAWSVYSYNQTLKVNFTDMVTDNRYDYFRALIQAADKCQQLYVRNWHIVYVMLKKPFSIHTHYVPQNHPYRTEKPWLISKLMLLRIESCFFQPIQ